MDRLGQSNSIDAIIDNPWRNVYWFARMLINNDKYGSIGKDNKVLNAIASNLRQILESDLSDDKKLGISIETINQILNERFKKSISRKDRIQLFWNDLSIKLETITDIKVFILTMENVMIPINQALTGIPNNDREYTQAAALSYMQELGDQGLATVINLWDDAGVQGCLNAERTAVVREYSHLKYDIRSFPENEESLIITAFIQEFERRLGQKRKSRAGGSLEDVTSFIFDFYGIKSHKGPEHFQADIEVDKWVKCNDGWLIGISCKRTLRERWKQVSSADSSILSKYKIKQLWHLITYDEDLSDDKITLLGSQRHVFYLRDESRRFLSVSKQIGMSSYVRPMTSFINDLKQNIIE